MFDIKNISFFFFLNFAITEKKDIVSKNSTDSV